MSKKTKPELTWTVRFTTCEIGENLHAIEYESPSDYEYMMNHFLTTPHLPMKSTAFMMKYIDASN